MRARTKTLTAVLVGIVFTLAFSLFALLDLAYRNAQAKIVLETAEALIAILTAVLILGRFRESGRRADLLLVFALLMFAGSNLLFSVLPRVLPGIEGPDTLVWAPLFSRLVGATALAAAAFWPPTPARRRTVVPVLVGVGASLGAIWAFTALFGSGLDTGIDPGFVPDAAHPRIVGHPLLLGIQLVVFGLFAAASVGFTLRAERNHDTFLGWVGAGTALGALARLNYFLFPSIYTDFVYTGDLLRLGFYVMLLIGSGVEIQTYWRRLEDLALVDPLTGLSNRHGFETLGAYRWRLAAREGRALAVVFIDLNDMKAINDGLGHRMGDRALLDTADVLRRTFRETDIVARLGGDEFCAVLAEPASPDVVVARLGQELAEHNVREERPYSLSLSVGVVVGEQGEALEHAVHRADEAMYADKVRIKAERAN